MDPTARVVLGKTSLQVTRLGLGGAPIGGLAGDGASETARAIVQRAYDLGIRLFDTAPLYGWGASERRMGAALQALPRDSFVLSTKVGRLIRPDENGTPQAVFDFSYDGVLRSFEESLRRLGLDRVDILLIHDPDRHFREALSGAYRALDQL